jgi:hypothetical protein
VISCKPRRSSESRTYPIVQETSSDFSEDDRDDRDGVERGGNVGVEVVPEGRRREDCIRDVDSDSESESDTDVYKSIKRDTKSVRFPSDDRDRERTKAHRGT